MKTRKRKYVAWYNNTTDHRDDEWEYYWACSKPAATALAATALAETNYRMYNNRFTLASVLPIKEARKEHKFL